MTKVTMTPIPKMTPDLIICSLSQCASVSKEDDGNHASSSRYCTENAAFVAGTFSIIDTPSIKIRCCSSSSTPTRSSTGDRPELALPGRIQRRPRQRK